MPLDDFASQLGPTIDELVAIAHDAGWGKATPRTIRRWVENGFVAKPQQQARKWRYPNVSIGQVDTLSRMLARGVHKDFFRFGLFVESGSGTAADARTFLIDYLGFWRQAVNELQQRLSDPDTLREEAEKAARQKGRNAPLPHRVRVTLDERILAMQFVLAQLASISLGEDERAAGLFQLERLIGLRSGRGGRTRDVSDLSASTRDWPSDADRLIEAVEAASDERVELSRRMLEIGVVWFPAMRSMLGTVVAGAAAGAPLVDVMDEWEEAITPDVYALLFAVGLANARESMSDERIRETLRALRPELLGALLLSSSTERELAIRRLRPYARMRLGAFLAEARSRPR